MKTQHIFAAAAAALTLGLALPAAADHNDHRRAEITVRTNHGQVFSVDRGDRLFYRLADRPYSFRPGLTYAYTDRCNRRGCDVLVFNERSRRPIDRIFAPRLPIGRYASIDRNGRDWRDPDWRFDGGRH